MKIEINTGERVVASFNGGKINAVIVGKKFTINYQITAELSRVRLADFAEALIAVSRLVAGKVDLSFSQRGKRIDPDEPEQGEGDYTVVYQVYPKDKTHFLTFTRYAKTGHVIAKLPALSFTDIPSAVQLANVARQASALMKQYEKV